VVRRFLSHESSHYDDSIRGSVDARIEREVTETTSSAGSNERGDQRAFEFDD
jgi:hypothetical protein